MNLKYSAFTGPVPFPNCSSKNYIIIEAQNGGERSEKYEERFENGAVTNWRLINRFFSDQTEYFVYKTTLMTKNLNKFNLI